MPSASTNSPMSASVPIMSSLCSRTRPVSVSATLEIFPLKLTMQVPSWQAARHACAAVLEGGRHLGAGLVTVIGALGQRAIDHALDARGEVGPEGAQPGVRRLGDLLHQRG